MRFSVLAIPLVLLMDIFIMLSFFNWHQESVFEWEQRQADLQVNYAIDAATQEMLKNTPVLYTDYANWGSMQVDPEVAYYTYVSLLIRNYGWNDIPENRAAIEDTSIPFFCVVAYDGYYMLMREPCITKETLSNGMVVENLTYDLKWTPKLPFAEQEADGTIYSYNLGTSEFTTLKNNTLKLDNSYNTYPDRLARRQTIISEKLNDIMNKALFLGTNGYATNEIYIPAISGEFIQTNAVERPSCITYLIPESRYKGKRVATFGLGGARIEEANFVICYKKNGIKYYTYAFNRSKVPYKIIEILTSPEIAAQQGYWYDMEYYN